MPLFLQALPLSLKTLWRYLLLLPFLTALSVAAALVAAFIPILGLVVVGVMGVFCTLAGLRCALSARGIDSELDLGKLLGASFWYFVLAVVAGLVMALFIFALGQAEILAKGGDSVGGLNDGTAGTILSIGTLALGLVYLLGMCAMAVPMTAAAATSASRGAQSDLFWGFGAGTISLVIVSVLGSLGSAAIFVLFQDALALYALLQGSVTGLVQRAREVPNPEVVIPAMIGSVVFVIWTTCWFFATAVLAWERARANEVTARARAVNIPRVSSEDLRALRQARMPGDQGEDRR